MYRLGIFHALIPLPDIERMTGSIERTAWGYEYIITKSHLRLVEDDTIGIGKEVVADLYIIAIITEKRSNDGEAFSGLSKEFPETAEPLLAIVWRYLIYLVAFLLTTMKILQHLRVMIGIIKHASLLFFFLCHIFSFSLSC